MYSIFETPSKAQILQIPKNFKSCGDISDGIDSNLRWFICTTILDN